MVIKRSREVQKAAKNSIFATHRGDLEKASELIATCEKVGSLILEMLPPDPTLRSGAFSNALEEYAEAKLFFAWAASGKGAGVVLGLEDMGLLLEPEEYIGDTFFITRLCL